MVSNMSKTPSRTLLDIEDDDAREHRILSLLQRTDATSKQRTVQHSAATTTTTTTTPHAIPISDLISRAEAFLPRLAASNDDLMHRAALDPASVDIEHLPNTDAAHIELNLGLGVFEQRSHEQPGSDPDSDSGSDASSEPNSEDYSDSDDSSADDSDSDSSADSPSDDHSHTQTQTQTHTKPDIKSS